MLYMCSFVWIFVVAVVVLFLLILLFCCFCFVFLAKKRSTMPKIPCNGLQYRDVEVLSRQMVMAGMTMDIFICDCCSLFSFPRRN